MSRKPAAQLKLGAAVRVLDALDGRLKPATSPEELPPVRTMHCYLSNRVDRLDYPRALALGLPIGFGMIESGQRHVLQARLK